MKKIFFGLFMFLLFSSVKAELKVVTAPSESSSSNRNGVTKFSVSAPPIQCLQFLEFEKSWVESFNINNDPLIKIAKSFESYFKDYIFVHLSKDIIVEVYIDKNSNELMFNSIPELNISFLKNKMNLKQSNSFLSLIKQVLTSSTIEQKLVFSFKSRHGVGSGYTNLDLVPINQSSIDSLLQPLTDDLNYNNPIFSLKDNDVVYFGSQAFLYRGIDPQDETKVVIWNSIEKNKSVDVENLALTFPDSCSGGFCVGDTVRFTSVLVTTGKKSSMEYKVKAIYYSGYNRGKIIINNSPWNVLLVSAEQLRAEQLGQ